MQRSLQFVLVQEVGELPYWRSVYSEIDDQGNGKQAWMPIALDATSSQTLEQLISDIKLYQPDAPPDALSQAKSRKLLQIQNEWDARLKQGYDSGRGTLGFTAEDVALLSGAFALAKEADAVGLAMPSLVTLEDTLVTFQNIQEMTALMLSYGASRSHISVQFASRRRAVQNATTIEEVEAA